MRIVSGILRGKTIIPPEGDMTRPTADRARESLFNILNSLMLKGGFSWDKITFADVFSGSGAIGLEAYSRGAKEVFCIENDPVALKALHHNVASISKIHVIGNSALNPPAHAPVDILFMDAPYGKGLWQLALGAFDASGWVSPKTLIIIETDKKLGEELPKGYRLLQTRSQGRNTFLFATKES
ncbi:MAG: RsmD family RNA methyltransferase [Pseudomonadota bacterium]|nr:RsmD family RNA methyltransferase [Pseudomonadota bacterium]